MMKRTLTQEEIESKKSPNGGWSREQLEEWGVPWPPPKGWRDQLVNGECDMTADLDRAESRVAIAMERLRKALKPLRRIDPALEQKVFALHASLGSVLDALRNRR